MTGTYCTYSDLLWSPPKCICLSVCLYLKFKTLFNTSPYTLYYWFSNTNTLNLSNEKSQTEIPSYFMINQTVVFLQNKNNLFWARNKYVAILSFLSSLAFYQFKILAFHHLFEMAAMPFPCNGLLICCANIS